MALRKPTSKKNVAGEPARQPATAVARRQEKATPRRADEMTDAQKRSKLLKERFCPEGVAWLKENLGIDVASSRVPLQVVYDIAGGCVTSEPVEAVVKPLAYDRTNKENVVMPPIKIVGSFRIVMPYDRETGAPVPPSAERPVNVASYPCFDMVMRSAPSEAARPVQADVGEGTKERPKFTPQMVMALEGIGIREDRLYSNSFNAIPEADLRAMHSGEAFDCTGTVRIADGFDGRLSLNVNGLARLETAKDGAVVARFQPQYPVEPRAGYVIDILKVNRLGNLEIDIYDRDSKGYRKTDVYGLPILNKAGKDLVDYGRAFGLMDGYSHVKEYNNGRFEERVEKNKYEVSVVNGGLCVTKARRVVELGEDGQPLTTVIGGKEVEKFHYESAAAKVVKDKKGNEVGVRVGNQELKPATPKDLENYKRGIGGKFVGFETKDFKTGKKIVYDAYVVPDNRRNGYGKAYSQKVSEELFARREEKKAAKRQNYSMGL